MASAPDIITYVGIPLAVLGVVPTMYTCVKSVVTLRSIRKTLEENGVSAITRGSVLSGIVEIEIPRRSITPLDRADPQYFELSKTPSRLKGGSWTLFSWKELVIGVKAYRLQYHDELSQPQAEVEFEQLVAFLLDRGAVPSVAGFSDLRSSGLWTPAGTKLLLAPTTADAVLMVSTPDDSDGILSLSLNWQPEWDRRNCDSLPPYWIRIHAPAEGSNVFQALRKAKSEKEEEAGLSLLANVSPVRLRIGSSGIDEAYREDDPKAKLALPYLNERSSMSSSGLWFTCAATALGAPRGGLWSFAIPEEILSIARRESVPSGIMVLLGIMGEDEVPTWRLPYDDEAERFERHIKFVDSARKMDAIRRLPPDQQAAARRAQIDQDATDFFNDNRRRTMQMQRRREEEIIEALNSQKVGISVIGEASRKWLVRQENIVETMNIANLVEDVLFSMIESPEIAYRLASMLDLWRNWTENGGMTKTQFQTVKEDQLAFALASCVLYLIKETSTDPAGAVVSDLQECLRMWRKVRLG